MSSRPPRRRSFGVSALPALLAALVLGGCAVGNTHTFRYTPPEDPLQVETPRIVLFFEIDDQRRDIVSGDEPRSWVGEQRSGYGIPYTVKTTSGKDFADVARDAMARDLEAVGFTVESADRQPPTGAARRADALTDDGADVALHVVMRKFNSNTYTNIDVEWDFELTVYDASGEQAFEDRVQGKQTLTGSFWNPVKAAKERVPPFFNRLVHEMIAENEDLLDALAATTSTEATERCTVDQVLEMKESGLSDRQIRAACGDVG
ncbi:MAG: hypothetical protein AAGC60_20955 [Acidobacteriota bacterium]